MTAALMPDSPLWLKEIDHTADVGIEVTADSEKQLFEHAAYGMFEILTSVEKVRPVEAVSLAVEGDDREALLVHWLSELNYVHQVERMLFCNFEIASIEGNQLKATVYGEKIDLTRHTIHSEIKAVTFHDMKIRQRGNEWCVQIIFDM